MSKTVDQRVVEMQFDNRNFETNVKTSLSTIEKLKQSLDLLKSSQSLDNLNKPNVLSGFQSAVETVQMKFSALEVAAVTALSNIVNRAVNAGLRIANALTIQPITQGYNEYELKLGSIQTIMMSTGESMETVNRYLEELNTYADRTIYSFSDMTANIGKFTNAGVSLDMAVKAIQGVSNVAAVSGANAAEASRAMYNFSQALSAGYVKLIDWKSIENANMATVEFKQQLIDTAVQLGKLEKQADGTYKVIGKNATGGTMRDTISATKNFNDSLSYQWMTTEVLTKTLAKYTDETTEIGKKAFAAATEVRKFTQLMDTLGEAVGSGWAQTFEIIFGNFEEATKLWTNVNNAISPIIDGLSDARNEVLLIWKALGGRDDLLASFRDIWETAVGAAESIGNVFDKIFPHEKTFTEFKEEYTDLLSEIHKANEKDYWGLTEWEKLENFFGNNTQKYKQGLIDAAIELGRLEKQEDGTFKIIYDDEEKLESKIVDIQNKFSDSLSLGWLNKDIISSAATTDNLLQIYLELYDVTDHIGSKLAGVFKTVREFLDYFNIGRYIKEITDLNNRIASIRESINKATNLSQIEHLEEILNDLLAKKDEYSQVIRIGENFKTLFSGIFSLVKAVSTVFSNLFKSASPLFDNLAPTLLNIIELVSRVAAVAGTALQKFSDWIVGSEALTKIFNPLTSATTFLANAIDFLISMVTNIFDKIREFVTNSDILGKLSSGLESIKNSVKDIIDYIKGNLSNKDIAALSIGLNNIFSSVLTFVKNFVKGGLVLSLGASIKSLVDNASDFPETFMDFLKGFPEAFKKLLGGGSDKAPGIIDTVRESLTKFQESLDGKTLKNIAIAIGILSVSLALLAMIDPYGLARGLGAIALEMLMLKKAMENLSSIDTNDKGKSMKKIASALIPFAAAILLLSISLSMLSKADPDKLVIGTVALVTIIGVMTKVAEKLSDVKGKRMTKGLTGLIALAIAINLLVKPIKELGNQNWKELAKGIGGVTVLIFSLAAAAKILNNTKVSLGAVATIIALASAISIITKHLDVFSSMNGEELLKSGGAILGLLTIMVTFVALLSEIKGSISAAASLVIMAGAIGIMARIADTLGSMDKTALLQGGIAIGAFLAAMTISLAALGAIGGGKILGAATGILLFATALNLLIVPLKVFSSMSLDSIINTLIILAGVIGVFGMSATILAPVIPAMLGLAGAIALLGVACLAVGAGLLAFSAGLTALSVSGVAAVDGLIVIVDALLEAVIKAIPRIIELIVDGIGTIISSVLRNISQFVVDLAPLIDTVLQLITDKGPAFITTVLSIFNNLLQNLILYAPMYGEAAIGIIVGLVNGLATGLDTYSPMLIDAFTNLFWSLLAVILNVFGMETTGSEAHEMFNTALGVVSGFISGIGSKAQELFEAGKNVIQGFWNGLKDAVDSVLDWVEGMGTGIVDRFKSVLGIASPSKVFRELGMYVDQGLAEGIAGYSDLIDNASNKTANSAISSMRNAISAIPGLFEDTVDYQPTIRPIMDLSEIQNGARTINGLMSGYSIQGSYNLARNAASYQNSPSATTSGPVANITLNAKTINRAEVDYLMNRANNVLLESAISFKG